VVPDLTTERAKEAKKYLNEKYSMIRSQVEEGG